MVRLTPARRLLLSVAVPVAMLVFIGACGTEDSAANTLVFSYDSWAGTYLSVYVLKAIFEDELGYTVRVADPTTVDEAYAMVGREEVDIFPGAWFPGLRNATLERDANLVKLGLVFGGKDRDAVAGVMISTDFAREHGLAHMRDLNDPNIARALDTDGDGKGNLIGAPFDWNGAEVVPEILSDYGLADLYEVDATNSEADLMEQIETRLNQGEPALFYVPARVRILTRSSTTASLR